MAFGHGPGDLRDPPLLTMAFGHGPGVTFGTPSAPQDNPRPQPIPLLRTYGPGPKGPLGRAHNKINGVFNKLIRGRLAILATLVGILIWTGGPERGLTPRGGHPPPF